MGIAALFALAFALLALYTAAFNTWIWLQRRSELAHLWLGCTALGVASLAFSQAMGYGATDLEAAMRWQRVGFLSAVPLAIGFLRFSVCFLEVRSRAYRRFLRAAVAYAALVAALSLAPDLLFDTTAVREIPVLGQAYLQASFTPFGKLCLSGFLVVFVSTIPLYWQHRDRVERSAVMLAALWLWIATGINDVAVAMGLYPAPLLMSLGYAGFTIAFTAVLVRRFVGSLDHVERSAESLKLLVEQRSAELREKELQLAHGERMATLGTLAAGVAHEINNPAAYVASNLNRLEEVAKSLGGEHGAETAEIIQDCQEGVDRIRAIVTDLLTQARRGEGANEPVDLRAVVESTLPIVRHQAQHRVRLDASLEPVPPVIGDSRLLGQVVLNLVVNAIQAFPEGGSREAQRVWVETSFQDGSVWLLVGDNAGGIDPGILPRVFEPFFTTKGEDEGTGLGLAVTRQLVSRHRGRIDVQSSAEGTSVVVELPAADPGTRPSP